MGALNTVKAYAKRMVGKVTGAQTFDMSSKESRQMQVRRDFENSSTEKNPHTIKMVEFNNYYNNKPYTEAQATELREKLGINFTPPVLTDPFIQVESQIDDVVPTFQFSGREGQDPIKAKEREKVTNFILYNNGINELNLDNERALNELGNAFWKVSWDGLIKGLGYMGDIVLGNPDPANIFPDPNAYDVDDCEFIVYAFRGHRRKLRRMFGAIIDTISNDGERTRTEIYENNQNMSSFIDETLLVIEYWYRDDEGDIACSIQINYIEVKHISKYWVNTRHSGNQMYPIVKYGKIPVRKSFWDKGEIETCKDLFDAGNREFITAILNDAFMANDITLYEEESLAEGQEMSNMPGANIKMKKGMIDRVKRLGGIAANGGILQMIQFIKEQIQETNGNYESAQGKEPIRVTTASGIAQLNEKANARKVTKKAGRTEGFKRLAQLVDWTALEFYNTNRMIMVGAKEPDAPKEQVNFNSGSHAMNNGSGQPYFPKVDVEIVAGDGIRKSKAFTLTATQELAQTVVTPENIGIVLSQVDLLDLPNKDEIREFMIQAVAQQIKLRQPAPQQQPPHPSESITFKDMPPSGKIQMAQQVGIQLTPQDFPPDPSTQTQPVDAHSPAIELTKLQIEQQKHEASQAHELQKIELQHQSSAALADQKHQQSMESLAAKTMIDASKPKEPVGGGSQ